MHLNLSVSIFITVLLYTVYYFLESVAWLICVMTESTKYRLLHVHTDNVARVYL